MVDENKSKVIAQDADDKEIDSKFLEYMDENDGEDLLEEEYLGYIDDTSSITGFSSSDLYLSEISYKGGTLLTKEQEIELGKRIREGDDGAFNMLVEKNLRLVVAIGKRFVGKGLSFEDIVQEGNVGLLKAARYFDPDRGYRFSTYATWWIRQAIQRAIMNDGNTIRIPVHMLESVRKLGKYVITYRNDCGTDPSEDEIELFMRENRMSVTVMNQVRSMMNLTSIDSLLRADNDGETTLGDMIPDTSKNTENAVLNVQGTDALIKVIKSCCSEREFFVLSERFGLESGSPKTLEEVGRELGVTRERVRQVESKALKKLRLPRRRREIEDLKEVIYQ